VTEGTRTPDLRDHNLNLPSALPQLLEPKGPRPAVPLHHWRPLVTADARAGPLRHGPSADRGSRSVSCGCRSALQSFGPCLGVVVLDRSSEQVSDVNRLLPAAGSEALGHSDDSYLRPVI
jgi:hypothetical protein